MEIFRFIAHVRSFHWPSSILSRGMYHMGFSTSEKNSSLHWMHSDQEKLVKLNEMCSPQQHDG
jgi:hypothetical protein